MAVEAKDENQSRLLGLATELQLNIYKYALVEERPIDLFRWKRVYKNWNATTNSWPPPFKIYLSEATLLKVCKHIRKEGLEIYYSSNIFKVPERSNIVGVSHAQHMGREAWKSWLTSLIKERRAMLTNVRTSMEAGGSDAEQLRAAREWVQENAPEVPETALYREHSRLENYVMMQRECMSAKGRT